jgi:hypothetical protein
MTQPSMHDFRGQRCGESMVVQECPKIAISDKEVISGGVVGECDFFVQLNQLDMPRM